MNKTVLDNNVIEIIRNEIKALVSKNNIVNEVLRNDVFALLEAQECTVLYYPLEDNIEGFRIRKNVNGKYEQFVYINTAKQEDIQIFTAAHELGHILSIDTIVCDQLKYTDISKKFKEDIIDRFAAELLMKEKIFSDKFDEKIAAYVDENNMVSGSEMLKVIVYLMDFFMAPYVAVVRRLYEINRINEDNKNILLDKNIIIDSIIDKVVEEGNYKRLKPTYIKSFGELPNYLEKLSETGEISQRRMNDIMKLFDIKEVDGEEISAMENIRLEKGV